jgi:hypothetical protein
MAATFLNADLEIYSHEALEGLVAEIGGRASNLYCGPSGDGEELASFEIDCQADTKAAEELIHRFCDLLESLGPESKRLCQGATRIVIDLGYEVDLNRERMSMALPPTVIERVANLGGAIAFTVYPVGIVSDPEGSVRGELGG